MGISSSSLQQFGSPYPLSDATNTLQQHPQHLCCLLCVYVCSCWRMSVRVSLWWLSCFPAWVFVFLWHPSEVGPLGLSSSCFGCSYLLQNVRSAHQQAPSLMLGDHSDNLFFPIHSTHSHSSSRHMGCKEPFIPFLLLPSSILFFLSLFSQSGLCSSAIDTSRHSPSPVCSPVYKYLFFLSLIALGNTASRSSRPNNLLSNSNIPPVQSICTWFAILSHCHLLKGIFNSTSFYKCEMSTFS